MRHLSTLIAAVFVAPLSWLLLSFGQDRSAQAFAHAQNTGTFDTGELVAPVMGLAGAGLLLGLLATLRFSPLGVVLTGAGYAASYLALLFDPDRVLRLFPPHLSLAGRSADPTTPIRTGTALLLGALMLVAAVSVSRWRRRPSAGDPESTVERAQDGPWDTNAPTADPELVTRYTSSPRSGNSGLNSSAYPNSGTGGWAGNRRPTWPYTQQTETRAHGRHPND